MDRTATRVDPLTRGESYLYDANGNLQQVTDRKGQVTAYTYDRLDRLATVTYADTSTTTYTYDAGDRLLQIVDSVAGTIARGYDGLDRLSSETTPEGAVSYTYDAANRRQTMTVAGQPQVSYGYDDVDRLTSITQAAAVVAMAHDNADRRTTLTLPNGVVVQYAYDAASQLTGLTYTLGAATLGTLTYSYDLGGQRTAVGGTWARTGLPAALASATYDAANQVTQWGGVNLTYDANGNLTNDGTRSYTWNARNELATLGGGVSASFQYDGLGRRRAKTIGGASTGFLYDGLSAVQELTGGSPAANLLTGLDLDEVFTRTDPSGVQALLMDALGTTVATADNAGIVGTQYSYEPFGATTATGPASANSAQFTGRENDGTGLYYYRARYQHPTLQRFVSEDPLGFGAGDPNLHAYVFNAPTQYTDPSGFIKGEKGRERNPEVGMPGGQTGNRNTPVQQIRDAIKQAKREGWSKDAIGKLKGLEKLANKHQARLARLARAGGRFAGGILLAALTDVVILESAECPSGPNTCQVNDPARQGGFPNGRK